jgi:ankyrin repeat protein
MIAVAMQQKSAVELLLQRGADPNIGNAAALWLAADRGDSDVIRLLLQHGADKKNFRPGWGTPRNAALAGHHIEAAELLK